MYLNAEQFMQHVFDFISITSWNFGLWGRLKIMAKDVRRTFYSIDAQRMLQVWF